MILDLFGDPVPPNHGRRGRPQHVPTNENRKHVSMMLALGWGNERIAAALRVTLPTLRKHYFSELKVRDVARDRLDLRLAMKLWDQVEAGNVGAMREFQRFRDRNDAVVGHNDFYAAQRRDEEPMPAPLGKKEAEARAALTAGEGTAWGNDLIPN